MPNLLAEDCATDVLRLTLNREEKRNALSAALRAELIERLGTVSQSGHRAVILTGTGPVFSAGMDLRERVDNMGKSWGSGIAPLLQAIESCAVPVIAAVQGDALAGGCELALTCDVVVAAEPARFGMPLAKLGLAPTLPLVETLVSALGLVGARQILLVGDPLPAQRLFELGGIAKVVPAEFLMDEALRYAATLATNAPLSLRTMRATFSHILGHHGAVSQAELDGMVATVRASADAQEGVRARLEKRPARFRGT